MTEVHDLHIWGMSTTDVALTVHLVKPEIEDEDKLIAKTCQELHDRYGIEHSTLQVERARGITPCALAPAHVI